MSEYESYHWYDSDGNSHHDANGIRDARKRGLYPSVTSVLKCWSNPFLDKWSKKECIKLTDEVIRLSGEGVGDYAERIMDAQFAPVMEAAEFGTAGHAALEQFNIDQTHECHDETYRPYFLTWRDWFSENVSEAIAAEKTRVHAGLKTAGTIDFTFKHPMYGVCVLDYKFRKWKPDYRTKVPKPAFYDKDCQQLSVYADMVKIDLGLDYNPRIFSCCLDVNQPGAMEVKLWDEDKQARGLGFFAGLMTAWRYANNHLID